MSFRAGDRVRITTERGFVPGLAGELATIVGLGWGSWLIVDVDGDHPLGKQLHIEPFECEPLTTPAACPDPRK
jgi:hypothetical protein